MEIKALEWALENGGVLGLVLTAIVLTAGAYFKFRGDRQPDVTNASLSDQIRAVSSKVGAVEKRVDRVESEIDHLPTRAEMHKLQMELVRIDQRVMANGETTKEARNGINRIEGILIELGTKS